MPAPDTILELINRFGYNLESYKKGQYNETQVRLEYINPLMEELGWDVRNKQGYSEAYKDVIHEDAIKVGGVTKAPDYCFRIGGTRKFFLEAKKPSVNIKQDIHPAYQLRRYAWSAKLPLSILTDFEEFAVYDSRIKPSKTDKASNARVMYFKFADYKDKWDEIAGIFSHESILKGSFDKYVDSKRKKKGTAEVDTAFLEEIERWRELLARNIALRNEGLSQREVNFSVQRTIDRIIFLRICEDRGIEDYGRLMALQNGERVYKRLFQLFREADARYNSGLFYFRPEKGRSTDIDALTPDLNLDDKVLKDILKNLYYPDSPYEFSVLPSDILGQVYEQFLGKVIRLTSGHRAVIELKPEVRKAGGVYYTPTYIVDYIVKETVGKLVEGKKPGPRGGVSKLKILDPACGSGSFLLGAYQYLLDWHRDKYVKDGPVKWAKGKNPCLYQKSGDNWRLTTDERKRILLNNIHGVDIDHQAVEVTKLSLLLKVLEGEDEETIQRQLSLFQKRALPDLGNNIKCGNSLIGSDFYDGQLNLFDEEEMYRINSFDWENEFSDIMKNGGFDAVIGNPPYIRIQRIAHNISDYLFRNYKSANSKTDLSLFFLERALSLVTKSGLVGFICTSQWLSTDYGKNMRKMLSDGQLHEIVDFGSLPVFHKADTYPAIFISSRSKVDTLRLKRIKRSEQLNLQAIEDVQVSSIELDSISEGPWNLGRLDIPSVLKQREVHWKPLQNFVKAYIGLLTGMDKAFVVSKQVAEQIELEESLILPYAYRGAEVKRYAQVQPDARVIYPYRNGINGSPELIPEAELRQSYPKIYQHLLSYKNALRTRKDSRKFYAEGSNWFRHLRPGSFNYIHPTKFIIKGIDTRTTIGLLEKNTAFNGANCPGIIVEDSEDLSPLYILGLLNSSVISYYLRKVCPAKLGGYTRFNARNINNTPIRLIDFSNPTDNASHNGIVTLVEKILYLNQQLAKSKMLQEKSVFQRQIEATDRQINKLVYKLYDLTDEDIKIVEASTD